MREADVVRIVKEEWNGVGSLIDASTRIQIRVATEILARLVRPSVSDEQWKLFLDFAQVEPALRSCFKISEVEVVLIELPKFLDALHALEKAYQFLLDGFEQTSDHFRETWSKDELLKTMCTFSVKHDKIIDDRKEANIVAVHPAYAVRIVNYIRWAQIGFAGDGPVNDYTEEMNGALLVMRDNLKD